MEKCGWGSNGSRGFSPPSSVIWVNPGPNIGGGGGEPANTGELGGIDLFQTSNGDWVPASQYSIPGQKHTWDENSSTLTITPGSMWSTSLRLAAPGGLSSPNNQLGDVTSSSNEVVNNDHVVRREWEENHADYNNTQLHSNYNPENSASSQVVDVLILEFKIVAFVLNPIAYMNASNAIDTVTGVVNSTESGQWAGTITTTSTGTFLNILSNGAGRHPAAQATAAGVEYLLNRITWEREH